MAIIKLICHTVLFLFIYLFSFIKVASYHGWLLVIDGVFGDISDT